MSNINKEQVIFILQELENLTHNSVIIKGKEIIVILEKNTSIEKNNLIREKLSQSFPNMLVNVINTAPVEKASEPIKEKLLPKNVKKIILVASCKGGVGKSTITSAIAYLLSQNGYKIGIVDADIYGPSLPTLLNTEGKIQIENNHFVPMKRDNISVISMGNIVDPEKAAIWRGPMVSKTLYQLMMGTKWEDIDILLVDTPPGTGDVALSLMEKYQISSVVLVTTPHLLSTNELVKSIDMFNKLNIPIIGVIENMSYYEDDNGHKQYLFGKSNLSEILNKNYIALLAQIPIIQSENFMKTIASNCSKLIELINRLFK